MTHRATIAVPATFAGVGLFTEQPCKITIEPAPAGAGIVFVRDEAPDQPIRAHIDNLFTKPPHPAFAQMGSRWTALALGDESAPVFVVEHILSALTGLGITDTRVLVDGPEIPIGDGSAAPFTLAIRAAGVAPLDAAVDPITPAETIVVEDGDAKVVIEPADRLTYSYQLDYGPSSPIAAASVCFAPGEDDYAARIAPARTFCLRAEAEAMHAGGLFTQLTPADMLVIGDSGPIDNEYRLPGEPARHKLLDLIGDLALAGRPICAHITGHRSGHALNHRAARALADSG